MTESDHSSSRNLGSSNQVGHRLAFKTLDLHGPRAVTTIWVSALHSEEKQTLHLTKHATDRNSGDRDDSGVQ